MIPPGRLVRTIVLNRRCASCYPTRDMRRCSTLNTAHHACGMLVRGNRFKADRAALAAGSLLGQLRDLAWLSAMALLLEAALRQADVCKAITALTKRAYCTNFKIISVSARSTSKGLQSQHQQHMHTILLNLLARESRPTYTQPTVCIYICKQARRPVLGRQQFHMFWPTDLNYHDIRRILAVESQADCIS